MSIKVAMYPHLEEIQPLPTNGISRVVKEYFKHLPNYDIELLHPDAQESADLVAIHAAALTALPATIPVVAHNHGLYWTSDDPNMGLWTHQTNDAVIHIVRHAAAVTVPSRWVAEVFRRDMHFDPTVIPHGIDPSEWQDGVEDNGYVLWNKNRSTDACDPTPVNQLAARAPQTRFLTTYAAPDPRPNVRVTGTVDHVTMKEMILKCSVYLATTKETFGIGTLEAMACFVGETQVDAAGIQRVMRRPYTGKLITVNTTRASIRVTAEHPFWTSEGWVAAVHLTEKHRLLYYPDHASTQEVYHGTIAETYEALRNHDREGDRSGIGDVRGGDFGGTIRYGSAQNLSILPRNEAHEFEANRVGVSGGNHRWGRNGDTQAPFQEDQADHQHHQYGSVVGRVAFESLSWPWNIPYPLQPQRKWLLFLSDPGNVLSTSLSGSLALHGNQKRQDGAYHRVVEFETGSAQGRTVPIEAQRDYGRNSPPQYEAISSIEVTDVVDLPVYNFTTRSSTYLAEGYLVHNCGKPILGFDYGGTADLVGHGYNGYLAKPGNYDDLLQGLEYCQKHAKTLGANARNTAAIYTWDSVAQQVARQYALTLHVAKTEKRTIGVVIPLYNKAATVLRAVRSVLAQTLKPACIYVVNNNSTDDYADQIAIAQEDARAAGVNFVFFNCFDQGVAHARNSGIMASDETYICCLDADDEMLPEFLEKCRRELVWDRSIGIAYTGMEVVNQEGGITASAWPGEYNFDAVLKGRNQVPTCCLFRREAWARAGGFRQRYAPNGAGSEDADLWLRIGLLGYGGKRAVAYPLFRYYLGGAVSGNAEYREKDWRGDKGWLATGQYPFAATFSPANKYAHPVRQYDQPEVSVIIPVSDNHIDLVWDAIDSVEAQTFRRWELIVVADDHNRHNKEKWDRLHDAFPFVKWQTTYAEYKGAGAARNLGVELAKAPNLIFLDADDWLVPNALEEMIKAHKEEPGAIIYSDYIGHSYMENGNTLQRLRAAKRLLEYNEKTAEAKVLYSAYDFDCELAQAQPVSGQDPYIWNVVSSLVPRQYHIDIGGFDVAMESWEDYDYFVRLAKAGKCFYHLAQPLLQYRFYTGQRRASANPGESGESGRQLSTHLLEYMRGKYERIENMPCSSCGGRRTSPPPPMMIAKNLNEGKVSSMSADDMVMVELIDGNIGDHLIARGGTSYGYHVHGDQFSMRREHAMIDRRVRVVTGSVAVPAGAQPLPPPPVENIPQKQPVAAVAPPQPSVASNGMPRTMDAPAPVSTPPAQGLRNPGPPAYDFSRMWGLNEEHAAKLQNAGVRTLDGLIMFGAKKVSELLGVPEFPVGRRIISEADKLKEAEAGGGRKPTKKVKAKRK